MMSSDQEIQEALRRLEAMPERPARFENASPHPGLGTLARPPLVDDSRVTSGSWATEAESEDGFDRAVGVADLAAFRSTRVAQTRLWTVHAQVWGDLLHPRPCQMDKRVRIDRVLVPSVELIRLGWTHGAIGVEVKRSGEKIGPPVSQALDYGRTAWILEQAGGVRIWLDWVFVWPMRGQGGFVASIMAQNRVGTATPGYGGSGYQFKAGEASILHVDEYGRARIGAGTVGAKAGRR